MDTTTSRPRLTALAALVIVAMAAITFVALTGIRASENAINEVSEIIATLQYNAVRGDCIRDKTADAEQTFRTDITDLLNASGDREARAVVQRRMLDRPNYADVVRDQCPPALKE